MQQPLLGVEVKELDDAKVRVARAIKAAIGDQCLKAYGDEGLMSRIVSGEGVPAYLARIYQDVRARRRFGLALLRGDPCVRMRMVIEIDDGGWQEIP